MGFLPTNGESGGWFFPKIASIGHCVELWHVFFLKRRSIDSRNGGRSGDRFFGILNVSVYIYGANGRKDAFFSYHLYEKSHQLHLLDSLSQASLRSSLGGKWFGTSLWSLSASSESALNCASGRGVSNGMCSKFGIWRSFGAEFMTWHEDWG